MIDGRAAVEAGHSSLFVTVAARHAVARAGRGKLAEQFAFYTKPSYSTACSMFWSSRATLLGSAKAGQ